GQPARPSGLARRQGHTARTERNIVRGPENCEAEPQNATQRRHWGREEMRGEACPRVTSLPPGPSMCSSGSAPTSSPPQHRVKPYFTRISYCSDKLSLQKTPSMQSLVIHC